MGGLAGGLRLRLDAYARKLENLRLPEVRANPIRGAVLGDPALWEAASGTARGVEGVVDLDVGRGDFGSGELPLGQGDPDGGCADLHAPLPP